MFLSCRGTLDTVWWIMSFITPRDGSGLPIRTCVPDARLPEQQLPSPKNRCPDSLLTMPSLQFGQFPRHNGQDTTLLYGCDMPFGWLESCPRVWYFAATNAKEQVSWNNPRYTAQSKGRNRSRQRSNPIYGRCSQSVSKSAEGKLLVDR